MRKRRYIPPEFGPAVRARRLRAGPKQRGLRALAAQIGISHPKLVGVEAGKQTLSYGEVVAWARAIGDDPEPWLRLAGYHDPEGHPIAEPGTSERAIILGQARDVLSRGPWSPRVADLLYAMLVELADDQASWWRQQFDTAWARLKADRRIATGTQRGRTSPITDELLDLAVGYMREALFSEPEAAPDAAPALTDSSPVPDSKPDLM